MSIQVGNETVEEMLISRVVVINPKDQSVKLPQKYRGLFRGAEELKYGRHSFRFPIEHMGYKKLVSSFQNDFLGRLIVDFKTSGFDEI